jgi:hypothetical protein
MKWILIGLGCVGGLIAMIGLVGSFLPRGHVASRRARYRQPPETVFAILTDFAAFPSWRPSVKSVEILPARQGMPSFREIGP